jgi:hypothetical protein
MPRDFFDPTPEQQNIVFIDAATLQKAQWLISGCEAAAKMPKFRSTTSWTGSRVPIQA